MLNEQYIHTLKHLQDYYKTLQCKYNEGATYHSFKVGDLVLYENQRNVNVALGKKGKFNLNWLGPYIIIEFYESGAYKLSIMDGTSLKEPINVMNLCKFYAQINFILLNGMLVFKVCTLDRQVMSI